ncbi:chromosome transmission fidelity protein 8 homolog [Ptychodera flava]|uniref:chromosome transmission fidelity protein 8 homolog n=1 Tax=Ptychodera flava TaxID=63121 RepID=UPI00396A97AB
MVQLFIKIASNDGCKEWTIVELQGELVSRYETDLSGNFIGDLHFNKKGVPILIIGHHILYGKVTDLDKPFVVLVKEESQALPGDDVAMEIDHSKRDRHYTVTAVIKRKIQFRTRPKPIIANLPKKV